jgi:hypothetical protein
MPTYTQAQLDSTAQLKASNAVATPGVVSNTPTTTPNFAVSPTDVRPAGTAFNPMQDLQRSSIQTTGKTFDVPKTFDAGTLGTTPKPVVPEPPTTPIASPDTMAGTATDYVTRLNEAQKQAETAVPDVAAKENASLYTRVKDLFGQQLNKGTDLLAQQDKANVGGITKQIEEQNLLVTQKANQYQKNIQMLSGQGRGITTGIISGQTDRERRLAAADIGAETAILQAMQGNLTLAKQTAQDAIDLKYKPIEDEIAQKLQLLELNAPQMTAEEKKRADITAGILQDQQQQIADKKKTEGDVSNVLAEAAKNGATQDVLQKIKSAQNVNDAIINAGRFISPTPEMETQVVDVGNKKVLINSRTGEQIRDLGVSDVGKGTSRSSGGGNAPIPTPDGGSVNVSSRAQSVYENPGLLSNYTPTEKGKIIDELSKSGADMARFSVNNVTAGQRDQIAQYDDLIRQGQSAEGILSDSKLDTGPIASRVQSAKSLVGKANPSFVDYRGVVDNMSSTLLKLRSGAAVTPQEFERIKGFIPSINDDEKTATQKINNFYNELDTARANYIKRSTQTSQQILDTAIKQDPTNLRAKYEY